MIVKGIEHTSREIDVEVSFSDVFEALKREVLRSVGIKDTGAYLSLDGKIVSDERNGGGSHSWIDTTVIVEEPTEDQLKAIRLCRELYSFMLRD